MRSTFVILLAMSLPATAQQGFLDGNQLHEMCQAKPRNAAFGYASGALEATQALKLAETDLPYCLPPKVKLRQAVEVMCKFIEDRPGDRHQYAGYLTVAAFAEAWPCATDG